MASRDNPDFLSAESLMDDKVVNTEGEDLGKFDDLMIDLEEGKIAYAALSFGGTLGMGNKLFAIPWKALTLRVHEHAFVLDVPKEVLKEAEGFDKDNWPATSRESLSTMYSYYGYQPYWEKTSKESIQLPGHAVSEPTTKTSKSEGVASGFLRASKIRGEKVFNRDGDHIGKIEDMMIDLQDGRIAYAVVSHGGILGLGSKHIPIPWQALSLRSRDNAFVVDLPKEALDKAEGLDKDKWPVTREELSRTFSYYKYQPYWQIGAAGIAGTAAATTMREREAMPEREVTSEITQTETTTRMEPEREVQTETVIKETIIEETIKTEETSEARAERERLARLEEERRMEAQPAVAAGIMIEREVPEFLSASTIKSDRVVNPAGEDLGRVEELMIDLESQRVAYAVLSFGGFLGMADKLFAIPMQALTLRPHEHAFTLEIPKEVLERAEGFDKDHWPLTREELSRSYTYFGYQPYWQAGGMRETEVSTGMPRETERGTMSKRSIVKEKEKEGRLKTAEELIAEQEKERLEQLESKETDQEEIDRLEREKQIAERREHKYDTKRV